MLELWYVNSVMIDNVNQFQRALPLLFHSSLWAGSLWIPIVSLLSNSKSQDSKHLGVLRQRTDTSIHSGPGSMTVKKPFKAGSSKKKKPPKKRQSFIPPTASKNKRPLDSLINTMSGRRDLSPPRGPRISEFSFTSDKVNIRDSRDRDRERDRGRDYRGDRARSRSPVRGKYESYIPSYNSPSRADERRKSIAP